MDTDSATARLHDLAISERGFVFDPNTGFTYSTNPCGLAILNGLKEGQSLATIVDTLRSTFEVDADVDLQRDIVEFTGLLRAQGLVPKEFEL